MPAVRVNQRTILVSPDAALSAPPVALGLYARVSSHDQRADLDRQVARLSEWAAKTGQPVVRVEAEVGSGMEGSRTKLCRLLARPKVSTVVVEHRDRLARMNAELVGPALSAHGRRLVVIDEGEVDDDLVRDMTEVLTSFCARLYGRRCARNREQSKALRCAEHDVGPGGLGSTGAVHRSDTPAEEDGLVSRRLREIAPPFVVDPPAGARVRTRLKVTGTDAAVLMAIGTHLGSLAGRDLAKRCAEGRLSAKEKADSRRERKRALTAASSSRWAGAITTTSEDAFGPALRNLAAERQSLRARIAKIERRLAIPTGQRLGRLRGYATRAERFQKQRRLQVLRSRLVVEAHIQEGRVSVCRGTKALARAHHHLDDAGSSEADWQERWKAERLLLTADGEKDQLWGNLAIRWHPDEHWVEIALPQPLIHLANRPHGRYRLGCQVTFNYRGDEVAAQAATGAMRYDISCELAKGRWYIDASWKCSPPCVPDLDQLREQRVLAVDLNNGHLAAMVVAPREPGRSAHHSPARSHRLTRPYP